MFTGDVPMLRMELQGTAKSHNSDVETQRAPEEDTGREDSEESGTPRNGLCDPSCRHKEDGGKRGWLVVIAGSIHFFFYLGLVYSFGIIQLHLAENGLAQISTLAFIGSMAACLPSFMSILTVKLIGRIGFRNCSLIGGVLLGLGEFLAGFSTKSLVGMFLTQGLLFGVGSALMISPAIFLSSLWFKKKRGLATGIVFGGAGVGSAVLAIVTEKLAGKMGLAMAQKIIGCVAWASCVPASFFMVPPPGHAKINKAIPWHQFKKLDFWLVFCATSIAVFPLLVPPFLLPLYMKSAGYSHQASAILLAGWDLSSAIGRVGMGFGADILLGPINSMLLCLITIAFTTIALWPFATTLNLLILFVILNGACVGGYFSLNPVVIGSVFGLAELPRTMSTITTGWTLGYVMGTPIANYLLERHGGVENGIGPFRPACYYAGSVTLVSVALVATLRFYKNKKFLAKV